ncbi:DNA polymerase lambda isoform X2 [Elaeis guineensis]|uniref:DNA polymerase n=1 Tax=Elaeis guineensis var. tenera TaxID=51953 RepID=A0A6J0PE72_ELAGV|nr:DNA polymerase lambda isoform X2 [Elaeis guineensis]
MAPRASQKQRPAATDPEGMFHGMVVFLVPKGVQPRRLQIWKQKLTQMGALVEDSFSKRVTHVLSMNSNALLQQVNHEHLQCFKANLLQYQWLENCLKSGEKVPEGPYALNFEEINKSDENSGKECSESAEVRHCDDGPSYSKRLKISSEESKAADPASKQDHQLMGKQGELTSDHQYMRMHVGDEALTTEKGPKPHVINHNSCEVVHPSTNAPHATKDGAGVSQLSSLYNPPDFNKNITEIFGKLINIYRALGDERRSFSYYKAILMLEKLPFKIESADQVKDLPTIGKSLQDHIQEIVTTGKLSKLEYFEKDEKVRTVTLFGEVWGIGPATARKLYEKGYRTHDDLKNDDSLTNSQRLGLKYFDDIKKKIPRHEVRDMEVLLQKAGEDVLPGVIVVCGGSYRRGKASSGDLDIIITHPDGDINFLKEDLVFSMHSTEGTDSGVDTYFGLCSYPGREQRHRIDIKVYPRSIYAFGLIAWTGNDVLNRRLRLLAESKGYRLDDTGLYLATQCSAGKRGMKSSTSMNCRTEKAVFDILGFPWLEPHERNL